MIDWYLFLFGIIEYAVISEIIILECDDYTYDNGNQNENNNQWNYQNNKNNGMDNSLSYIEYEEPSIKQWISND